MPIKERNTSHMLWFDVEKRYKTIIDARRDWSLTSQTTIILD